MLTLAMPRMTVLCRAMLDGPFKDHEDVRLMLLYSEALAHMIYAAADIVLVGAVGWHIHLHIHALATAMAIH